MFAAEGGLLRLDRDLKAQSILVADELMSVRGVAVGDEGAIFVGTRACGSGVIVRGPRERADVGGGARFQDTEGDSVRAIRGVACG